MKITSVHAFASGYCTVSLESGKTKTEFSLDKAENDELLHLAYQIIMRRKEELLAPLTVIEAPLLTGPTEEAEFTPVDEEVGF